MVDLLKADTGEFWGCGGALVASKYVITAAHCMDGEPAQVKGTVESVNITLFNVPVKCFNVYYNQVRLGEHDRSSTGEGSLPMISIDVVKAVNHESYNHSTFENDISLLELAQEAV